MAEPRDPPADRDAVMAASDAPITVSLVAAPGVRDLNLREPIVSIPCGKEDQEAKGVLQLNSLGSRQWTASGLSR